MSKKQKVLLELVLLTILPTTLIYIQLNVLELNGHSPSSVLVFIPWLLLVAQRIHHHRLGESELGLKTKLSLGVTSHFFVTIVGVAIALLLAKILNRTITEDLFSFSHFQYGFFTTAIIQQIILIAYPANLLSRVFEKKEVIIIGAALFMIVHIPFEEPLLNLPLTFVGGLVFINLFLKHINMYLLIASHAVLNFVFVMYGFISNHNIQF